MRNPNYQDPNSHYYTREKRSLVQCVRGRENRVLDLGCGAGTVGRQLIREGQAGEMIGVEIFDVAAREAARVYTRVHVGDLETMKLPYECYFDYVICGDILEHLRDPWSMLGSIKKMLKDGGKIVCSIPNVRYWRVLKDLVVRGRWEYAEAGIMDVTHLRFFTRTTFRAAISSAGFKVIGIEMILHGRKQRYANAVTGRCFEEFLGSQILCIGEK